MPEKQLNLSNLTPAQPREDPEARRARSRLGQGPLLRPWHQGPEVALGLAQDARGLRGRPDEHLHAARQAPRCHVEGRDADRAVPHLHAARQHPRPRPVRRRRRGDARDARREAPDQEHAHRCEAARRRRADEEAHRARPRDLGNGTGEGRGSRRDGRAPARAEGAEEAAPQGEGGHRRGAGGQQPRKRSRGLEAARPRVVGSADESAESEESEGTED